MDRRMQSTSTRFLPSALPPSGETRCRSDHVSHRCEVEDTAACAHAGDEPFLCVQEMSRSCARSARVHAHTRDSAAIFESVGALVGTNKQALASRLPLSMRAYFLKIRSKKANLQ